MSCCCGDPERISRVSPPQSGGSERSNEFQGPIYKRQCTDVFFLIIFLTFLGGLGYGIFYSVVNGDIDRILRGFDNDGNICGKQNSPFVNITNSGKDLTLKPYLVFDVDIKSIVTKSFLQDSLAVFNLGAPSRFCDDSCPSETKVFLHRCVPINSSTEVVASFMESIGLVNLFDELVVDIELCWREILYLCLIALGLSVILTLLFRFMAGVLVWILLISLVVGSIAATTFLWINWHLMNVRLKSMATSSSQLESETRNMMIYAIILSVVTVLISLVVLVMRKRIDLVVSLFREAGKAVHAMPLLLFQPIWTVISLCVIGAGWMWAFLWIMSAGNPMMDTPNGSVVFIKDAFMQVLPWYNLFAAIWIAQFCLACQNFVIAGAVAIWFFTRNKSRLGFTIATSTGRLLRYHMGSVALGSFLIAFFKFLRWILSFIEARLKNNNAANKCCTCLIKSCQCCLLCFEKFFKYLNTNAYIEMAIYGDNFCSSAQKAYSLLARNALRVAAINTVGDFVLFLGKLGVVTAVVFIGIELLQDKPGVTHIWIPILLAAIFAFIVAHCFISVYEVCIDAIFICFCEDCEMNDGLERPYFMSRSLMEMVENSKKALQALDERRRKQAYDNAAVNVTDEGVWKTAVPVNPA